MTRAYAHTHTRTHTHRFEAGCPEGITTHCDNTRERECLMGRLKCGVPANAFYSNDETNVFLSCVLEECTKYILYQRFCKHFILRISSMQEIYFCTNGFAHILFLHASGLQQTNFCTNNGAEILSCAFAVCKKHIFALMVLHIFYFYTLVVCNKHSLH